ncbi:hypothetical protein RF11_08587 [Thelohanellus kitauei]|uniref:Uncharacterized protein n=1 Tax=Thelohanellus kitauei TaxID=669202 RepID=A0A0C2MV76_THEKT|nr:hypothetical protein RF11_08587 [Thelohanellus kitauei]
MSPEDTDDWRNSGCENDPKGNKNLTDVALQYSANHGRNNTELSRSLPPKCCPNRQPAADADIGAPSASINTGFEDPRINRRLPAAKLPIRIESKEVMPVFADEPGIRSQHPGQDTDLFLHSADVALEAPAAG